MCVTSAQMHHGVAATFISLTSLFYSFIRKDLHIWEIVAILIRFEIYVFFVSRLQHVRVYRVRRTDDRMYIYLLYLSPFV